MQFNSFSFNHPDGGAQFQFQVTFTNISFIDVKIYI